MADSKSIAHMVIDATPDPEVERRLEIGFDLATRFESSITAVCSAWPGHISVTEAITPLPLASRSLERDLRYATAGIASIFEGLMQGKSIASTWCAEIGDPSIAIRDHGLIADLIVMGAPASSDHAHADPLEIAFRTGAPVLRLSRNPQATPPRKVLVGWKDRREAHCALLGALPFLHRAESILLVGIGDETPMERLSAVQDYVAAHGLSAQTLNVNPEGASAATALAQLARQQGHDLIVAGARAHGRWKERLFGGVTQNLQAASDINWLLAS